MYSSVRVLVYAQLTGQSSEAAEGCVTVKYSLAGHPSQNQLHFNLMPAEDTGLTVHRLAARTLIRSLEMEEKECTGEQGEGVKKKVVEVSVQSGVSSVFTAFIAVNKGNGEAIQGPLVRRNVPTSSAMRMACGMPMMDVMLCARTSSHSPVMSKSKSVNRGFLSWIMGKQAANVPPQEDSVKHSPEQPPRDPLLQLISLQKASGSWELDSALAAALGKTSKEVEKPKPASVNQEVWATILALIWLHGSKMDVKDEWELLAMKAVSWLRAQNAPSVTECVEAGNTLLGFKVEKDALGL